jgi:outer membrane protein assembly factor BamB
MTESIRPLLATLVVGLVTVGGAGFAQPKDRERNHPNNPASGLAAALGPLGFRGDGTGRFPGATPPLEWSPTKNILWSTKIGPNKYSSPVVADGRIFVVAEPALLVSVDAATGKILWHASNGFADLPEKVEEKPPRGDAGNTTPTPITDGRFVYVVFGTGIVACYDMAGERRWIKYYGQNGAPEYGRAASPALAGEKLLVSLSSLQALDAKSGNLLWKNKEVLEQYGTPIVAALGGVEVAVMPTGQIVRISDGMILASDLGGLRYASPILHDQTVYLIQAGASAQSLSASSTGKWEAKQLWDQELDGTFYASAVWDRGLIYAVSNEGNFYILDSADGKILASHELDLPTGGGRPGVAGANLYPSLAVAGNVLMVLNDQGDALVLALGREYKELHRNHLNARHGSTPAFDGKYIYLRGDQNLYCIGEGPRDTKR